MGADLRKKVFLEDLRLKEGETGVKRYEQQLKLQTEISQIENEYKAKLGKAQNLLEESILVGNRDDKIKAAIDRSYTDSGIDFRSVQTDAQRGANQTADTIERIVRFGLETNPKRTDASVGARTIEGRIYGDPPWRNADNFSYKWIDDSTMNRTINDYIEKNWDTIRWELANNQQLTVTFDAGKAIGEGFYNKNQMGLGISQAEYGQTSYVTLRLKLDQIEPQKVVVETAFPAGRGN